MIRQGAERSADGACDQAMSCARPRPRKIKAAVTLPIPDRACSSASAYSRRDAGMTSATSATPTANSPPTPKPGQKPVERRSPRPAARTSSAREERVHQDRDQHRLRTADAIAQHAEEQSARGPAGNEDRRGIVAGASRRAMSSALGSAIGTARGSGPPSPPAAPARTAAGPSCRRASPSRRRRARTSGSDSSRDTRGPRIGGRRCGFIEAVHGKPWPS